MFLHDFKCCVNKHRVVVLLNEREKSDDSMNGPMGTNE